MEIAGAINPERPAPDAPTPLGTSAKRTRLAHALAKLPRLRAAASRRRTGAKGKRVGCRIRAPIFQRAAELSLKTDKIY